MPRSAISVTTTTGQFLRLTGRACRCRPGAAALAGSGSVRRRERPGPASLDCTRLAPLLAGPGRAAAARAAPATTSAAPRSAPGACALNANDYILRKTNTFPSSDGAPARLVGRAPSSTIRTHLTPGAQPPVALAGAVTLSFPASFGRVQVESASCPRERELSRRAGSQRACTVGFHRRPPLPFSLRDE